MIDSPCLTDDHHQLRELVHDFAEREIKPVARQLDLADEFPWENVKKMGALGFLGSTWPEELGGAGMDYLSYIILIEEMARVDASHAITVSAHTTLSTSPIMSFGTPEQQRRFVPLLASGTVLGGFGLTEPGAGSDAGGTRTAAVAKGDHYVLNGSKIWTTHAQWADWMFNLVRTDSGAKPQEGISFILVDMKTAGIRVEPIVTTDLPIPGSQEVNQVFYDDVKVPKENLIGEINKGWTYAKYLLSFERGNAYGPGLKRALNKLRKIAGQTDASGTSLFDDAAFRAKLDDLEIQISALEYVSHRPFAALRAVQRPGAEASMMNCRGTELQQAISEATVEASVYDGMPVQSDTFAVTNEPRPGPNYAAPVAPYYFNLRKASIYAGSNEIQRNIMAKAVLGL